MPKVTENLRRTWMNDRAQSIEEREETQDGTPRSSSDIEIVDFDVRVLDKLLSLPLGTKFDARDLQKEILAEG